MKKIVNIFVSLLLILCLFGCSNKENFTSKDVADSIANITSDSDGNVIVSLVNGKAFSLGNLKGEKGEKGDKGDKGDPGINGINGLNGIDGINGSNGKDGRDASISTDFVTDVEFDDINRIKISYSDGTSSSSKRIQYAGENKCTIEYKLFDINDQLVTSIYDFLFYDGTTSIWYDVLPLDFNNKHYFGIFSNCEFLDGASRGEAGGGPSSFGFNIICPDNDCKVIINFKEKNTYTEIGYYNNSYGQEEILYEYVSYYSTNELVYPYIEEVFSSSEGKVYCNLSSVPFSMPNSDKVDRREYVLLYSNTQKENMIHVPSGIEVGQVMMNNMDDFNQFKTDLLTLFNSFENVNIDIIGPEPTNCYNLETRILFKPNIGNSITLGDKYAYPYIPITITIEED